MKTREEMVYKLAESCLEHASESEIIENYILHTTQKELNECFMDDTLAYYTMLDDDDLKDRYEEYIA
jgi:hypothetical protein